MLQNFLWTLYELGVSEHFEIKNYTREINNIHKNFELYQTFMHNFFCQNIPIFSLYMSLTRKIETVRSESLEMFWSGSFKTVSYKKSQINNHQYTQILLNFINFSWVIFYSKLNRNPHFTKLLTIWSTQFFVITHCNKWYLH